MISRVLSFLPLALKRLRSRPFLSAFLVLMTALIIGFAASIPIFTGAVSQRVMQDEIDLRSHTKGWPPFSVRVSARPSAEYPMGLADAVPIREWLAYTLRGNVGLPIRSAYVEAESPMFRLAPRSGDTTYTAQYLAGVQVVHVLDVDTHLRTTDGAPFGQVTDPAKLNVWLEKAFADKLATHVGEEFELGELYSTEGQGIPVRVAGIWQASDPADRWWYRPADASFDGALLVTADQFNAFISTRLPNQSDFMSWYFVFDDTRMNLDQANRYIGGLNVVARESERRLSGGAMDLDPREDLLRAQRRKTSLSLILYGFSLPVLIIMVSFLASLSATQARSQETETAVMVSRGATSGQVLLLAAFESLVVVLVALAPGLLLAMGTAYLLGSSTGFLSFGMRAPLPVSLYSADWRTIAGVVAVSVCVRLVATWRASRTSLVQQERRRARPAALMTGARFVIIALLALVTWYAYRQLKLRGTLALASLDLLDPRHDPLILLGPTLFIFTAPLIASELFVWLMYPLDRLGRFWPWVSGYLASANLARAGSQYRAPIYRLALCLTLGVFYASVALSADIWLGDLVRHEYGADLSFRVGGDAQEGLSGFSIEKQAAEDVPLVPDESYRAIPGVEAATRLSDFEAAIVGATQVPAVRLLSIERLQFPQVAYFRPDYAGVSLGELMNRLGGTPNGLLLPRSLAGALSLGEGDTVRLNITLGKDSKMLLEYRVAGIFDLWPTMYPDKAPVVVGDLDYLELNTAGVLPYHVWMKLAPGADGAAVVDGVRGMNVAPRDIQDLGATLQTESHRLERTGTFGMLSICFVAGALLSVADLLLHSAYMLRERRVVHATLRALGFGRVSIMSMVVAEELVSVAYSLVAGVACGVAGAILYVPFYPLGKTSGAPVPPFTPFIDWVRTDWMAMAVAAALLLAETLVLWAMTRTRAFEVLRLGAGAT